MRNLVTLKRESELHRALANGFHYAESRLPSLRTTAFERVLLFLMVALLPLEENIPSIAGFTFTFILFGLMAAYVMSVHPRRLTQSMTRPVFLACYLFLSLGWLNELLHPGPSYHELARIGGMVGGAILIAAILRDKEALSSLLNGYLVAGLWVSIVLIMSSFGALQTATAVDFQSASNVRMAVIAGVPLKANLNGMAFVTAQGTVVALGLALKASSRAGKATLLALASLCLVGTAMPMSRSGIGIVLLSATAVLFAARVRLGKMILIGGLAAATLVLVVPEVVWSRMSFSTEVQEGRMEARAETYTAALSHLEEYFLFGVGEGNFWDSWALENDMVMAGKPGGAHNCFFQVTIYWGIAGLFGLLLVVWQAYRCLPRANTQDRLAVPIPGLALSLLLLMMVMHNLYSKDFSIGLGLLVGSRCWIWPRVSARVGQMLGRLDAIKGTSPFVGPEIKAGARLTEADCNRS